MNPAKDYKIKSFKICKLRYCMSIIDILLYYENVKCRGYPSLMDRARSLVYHVRHFVFKSYTKFAMFFQNLYQIFSFIITVYHYQ